MSKPSIDLCAYLDRIGYGGATAPSLANLRAIQLAHATRIAFENVDVLLGRPILLDAAALERKLVRAGRGGYCFEQNGLLRHALRALDFEVTILAARVRWRRPDHVMTPRTHMLLRVELPEGPFIADVGFGGATPTVPLALEAGIEQDTGLEPFRLLPVGAELQLQVRAAGEWSTLYQFSLEPLQPVDLDPPNWFVATHPDSFFVNHLMAARPTAEGRHAILDDEYSFQPPDGSVQRRRLNDAAAITAVLRRDFLLKLSQTDEQLLARRFGNGTTRT
ncbi:MAG: arylamine N-acetyltransferase family protein [Geminicoccaceae bacterium]